jgi:L-threonine kinase
MRISGEGSAPGSCGELAQGQLISGETFLLSLPVDLWSQVHVELDASFSGVVCEQSNKEKTHLTVTRLLADLGHTSLGARVQVQSDIPVGKSMASSTADITAACRAVGAALDAEITPELISSIAKQIEPSSGIMYPGVVCYDHIDGRLIEALGAMPHVRILVLDTDGEVDTLAYNQNPIAYSKEERELCEEAFQKVRLGVRSQYLPLVGDGATRSARINQTHLYKPQLEECITLAKQHGAHGVCIAHSGTLLGLIFGPQDEAIMIAQQAVREQFGEQVKTFVTRSI